MLRGACSLVAIRQKKKSNHFSSSAVAMGILGVFYIGKSATLIIQR